MEKKIVKYGSYVIAVDIEKTKEYYNAFSLEDTQANKNYKKHCNNLSKEEHSFFESFGIDPVGCNVSCIGSSRKKRCSCFGRYYFCGEFIEYPPEESCVIDELEEDEDYGIYVGHYRFEFQVPEYESSFILKDIPEGFLSIRFRCEDMNWFLREKPEQLLYEPPKPWEIHKRIGMHFIKKALVKKFADEEKERWTARFDELGITYTAFSKRRLKKYKVRWVEQFAPLDTDKREMKELCIGNKKMGGYLWHLFSFCLVNGSQDEEARAAFEQCDKTECVIINNIHHFAYEIKNADKLKADVLGDFIDVTISSAQFQWTYSKTHEYGLGPYFCEK